MTWPHYLERLGPSGPVGYQRLSATEMDAVYARVSGADRYVLTVRRTSDLDLVEMAFAAGPD